MENYLDFLPGEIIEIILFYSDDKESLEFIMKNYPNALKNNQLWISKVKQEFPTLFKFYKELRVTDPRRILIENILNSRTHSIKISNYSKLKSIYHNIEKSIIIDISPESEYYFFKSHRVEYIMYFEIDINKIFLLKKYIPHKIIKLYEGWEYVKGYENVILNDKLLILIFKYVNKEEYETSISYGIEREMYLNRTLYIIVHNLVSNLEDVVNLYIKLNL